MKLRDCIILLSIILLTGCQGFPTLSTSKPNEAPSYELPTITPKYDKETISDFKKKAGMGKTNRYEGLVVSNDPILSLPDTLPASLTYNTGIDIPYPNNGVRGLYISDAMLMDPEYMDYILEYVRDTELNTVVIDFKTDYGHIANQEESDNPVINEHRLNIDMRKILERLEEYQIYPIARIVTFKDNLTADASPDLSFFDKEEGSVWADPNGSKYLNPFLQSTWDYILEIAEEAAKLGFKDIQFDYVRFPEGFFEVEPMLEYNIGDFSIERDETGQRTGYERVEAINHFLEYAKKRLTLYDVQVSADIFGYTAIAGDKYDVRGIGQNFAQMAERLDTVSSMIYPSHWDAGFLGFDYPDLYPYEFVDAYIKEEQHVFDTSVKNEVNTRPWLQDFTWYKEPGTFLEYGPAEVEAQIQALADNGIYEFLLWNASGEYQHGVDYYKGP